MRSAPFSRAVAPSSAGRLRTLRFVVGLLGAPTWTAAQVVVEGAVSVDAGGTLLDGDRAAYQQAFQQRKRGGAGLDEFAVTRSDEATQFRLEGRFRPADEDYRAALRFERFDVFFVDAGFRGFRTWSDGSGGRFLPRNLAFSYFDEALGLDRNAFHFEIGTLVPDRVQWRLRYARDTLSGTTDSQRWGVTELTGVAFGARSLIPAYFVVEEARESLTLGAERSTPVQSWRVAARAERTRIRQRHVARRNIREPDDRYDIQRLRSRAESLSGHGAYERVISERLRLSAGGLATTIDTHLDGGRAFGATPDAEFSPTFVGRQNGDAGTHGLTGHTWLRQYLGNASAHYQATRNISVVAAGKYERLRVGGDEDHFEFDTEAVRPPGGRGPATLVTTSTAAAGFSRDVWNELTEELELRQQAGPNVRLYLRGQLKQGTGTLVEQSTLVGNRGPVIDRDSDYTRLSRRYDAGATWFARPGLTLAAQYAYRSRATDQSARRDNTANTLTSGNRYPVFLIDSRLASHEGNLRLSWRVRPNLQLASRYGFTTAETTTTFAGFSPIANGRLDRHTFTQTATWHASPRLFFTGAANVTFDRLAVPANPRTYPGDNNFGSASLGAGYAAGKVTDLFLDLSHYRADNYTDNPAITLPLNSGRTQQAAFVTWVRRQNPRLVYTVRGGFARNRDGTFGGQDDFDARVLYAKVQFLF